MPDHHAKAERHAALYPETCAAGFMGPRDLLENKNKLSTKMNLEIQPNGKRSAADSIKVP